MQIKFSNNKTIDLLKVEGGKRFIQNAQRDVLNFYFSLDSVEFNELDELTSDISNLEKIIIFDNEGNEYSHESYVLRQSLSKKFVSASDSTPTSPEVKTEQIILELAQETFLEHMVKLLLAK